MSLTTSLCAASAAAVTVVAAATAAAAGPSAIGVPANVSATAAQTGARRHLVLQLKAAPGALVADTSMMAGTVTEVRLLGLHVDDTSPTHLVISGPQEAVDHYFPVAGTGLGAVRAIPGSLSGEVSPAVDADDTTAVAARHLNVDPSQLATDYAAAAPGGYARVRPALTPQSPIVATLQLVGFDPAPLTAYAQQVAFAGDPSYDPATMPAGAPQFTEIGVGRAPGFQPAVDSDEASSEFALDEQAILGAAPEARLRAYVAGNNAAGQLSAADRALSDVLAGAPIVAFSTSWGACEARINDRYLAALDDVYHRLTSAGVTVFAASGDDGTLDCRSTGGDEPAVDFPASSPWVVGVGGTQHTGSGPDTAWVDARDGSGTGGGRSNAFYRPSYQAGVGSGDSRMVPDIAVDADARTGFAIYRPDHSTPAGYDAPLPNQTVGGTSLAAPLAAALLTNTEVAHGFVGNPRGLGDIHRALYTANAVAPGSITDVLTADDPSVASDIAPVGAGYDRATGLGVPVWSTLAAALYAPVGVASAGPRFAVARRTPSSAQFTFSPPRGSTALGWYVGDAHDDPACSGNPLHAKATIVLPLGRVALAVHSIGPDLVCSRATDMVVFVGVDDRAGKRSSGWASKHDRAAYGTTYVESHSAGATVTWSNVDGRAYDVLLDRAKAGGTATISIDGKLARTVELGSGRNRWALASTVSAARHGRHTITVRVLSGTVRVDGLAQHL